MVTGSSQPKIFDREGHALGQFVKGDMYIRDLKNTKGHQYRCCSGQWHPTDRCAPRPLSAAGGPASSRLRHQMPEFDGCHESLGVFLVPSFCS